MANVASRENRQLRRRVRELEEETKFLRMQNQQIQKVGDKYRGKISRFVDVMRLKIRGENRLAFATKKELEELLGRLRASEIRFSSQHSATGVATKCSLSFEEDNGLIHSTDSMPQSHSDRENSAKVSTKSFGKKTDKTNTFSKRYRKPYVTEEARNVWWDTIAKLTTDNKKLGLLVETLKMRVDSATRLNTSLEKKVHSLSLLLSSRSSTTSSTYDVSQLQKELAELKAENKRLRIVEEHNEQLTKENLAYRELLEQRNAAIETVRRREITTLNELTDVKDKLSRAKETNKAMETALRLSKIREGRMASSIKNTLESHRSKTISDETFQKKSKNNSETARRSASLPINM